MPLELAAEVRRGIESHAEETFPEECCGVLLGRDEGTVRRVHRLLRADNVKDENRLRRYLIDPRALLGAERQARREGCDVVGIYHSHPDHPSQASEFDREHALPFWSYVIVSCMNGVAVRMQSWRLCDDRSVFDEEAILA
jgi:proteasome lid subunit RPN8/RPN11